MKRLKGFFMAAFGWMWGARLRKVLAPLFVLGLIAAAVAGPLVYARRLADAKVFWDIALGSLMAAMIALIVGIPIAFWLIRGAGGQRKPDEPQPAKAPAKASDADASPDQHAPEKELLALIKAELKLNLSFADERLDKPDHLHPLPFKPDFWDAAMCAGNLRLISSRKMLDHLSGAYYMVHLVRRTEELTYRALTGATVMFGNRTAVDLLLEDAQRLFDPLKTSLADTIRELDKHVKSLAKPVVNE